MKKIIKRLIKIIHPESIEDGLGKLREDLWRDTREIHYELGKNNPDWEWIQNLISQNDIRIKNKPLIKVTLEYDEWQINKQTINESYQIGQDIRKIKTELYNLRLSKEISDFERIQKLISKNDALVKHNSQIQDSLVFDEWLICRDEFLKAYRFPSARFIGQIIKLYSSKVMDNETKDYLITMSEMDNEIKVHISMMSEFMTFIFIKMNPEFEIIDLYKYKKFFIEFEKYLANFNNHKDVEQFFSNHPDSEVRRVHIDRIYEFMPLSIKREIRNNENLNNQLEDWFNKFLNIFKDAFAKCKQQIDKNPDHEYNRILNDYYG